MRRVKDFVLKTILEARTKNPGDLSQEELKGLISYVLSGDGVFDFTEKFAGSHAEILLGKDGKVYSKSKSSRQASADWLSPSGKSKSIADQLSFLEIPSASRRFAFEFIDSIDRPDYVNYLIGETPVAVEYSGQLTKEESDFLNEKQNSLRFVSQQEIKRDGFNLSSQEVSSLENLYQALSSEKLKRKDLKSIGLEAASIIASASGDSILGGPIEGLMVSSPSGSFKIPNPEYAQVQRLQSPLYAMFSGRGGTSKREVKSRIVSPAASDRLIRDLYDYLEKSADLPEGFRTFFTPEEAQEIISLLDDSLSGDSLSGEEAYKKLNRRINSKRDWVNT